MTHVNAKIVLAAWLAALILFVTATACPAEPAAPLTDLGVDLLTVKGGPRLLGAIYGKFPNGAVQIAVQREWLKAAHPKFYDKCVQDELAESRRGLEILQDRLKAWIDSRPEAESLLFFLKPESERVAKQIAKLGEPAEDEDAPPQFMLLEFPKEKIERVFSQTPARKQIALVAWREKLPNVESRSVTNLTRTLQKQGIKNPTLEKVDFSDQVTARTQTEKEWAARMAIVEYAYHKHIDFQGTGDLIIRTDEAADRPDIAQLAGEMLKSQIGGLLDQDGAGKPKGGKWWNGAIKIAEKEQVRGFRITRVDQDLAAKRVSVESRFIAKMPDESWLTVWTHTETADASKARPEIENRISKDPQISQALDLAKAAGLSIEGQLQTAMRGGAATMEAQQTADSRFFQFRDRFLHHLDSPPLTIAP